jgi:hypothetical protein
VLREMALKAYRSLQSGKIKGVVKALGDTLR